MKKILLVIFIFIHYTISSQWKTGYYTDEFGDKTETTYKYLNAFGTFSNSATQGERLMCELKISGGDDLYITAYEYNDKLATFISHTWENVKLKSPDGKVHNFGVWFSANGSLWFSDKPPYNVNDSFDKNSVTKNNYTRIIEVLKQNGIHKIVFNRTSDISAVDSSYKISFTINSGFSSKALDSKTEKLKRKINLQKASKEKKRKDFRNNEINRLLDSIKSVKFDKTSIERIYLTIESDITKGLNNIKSIKVKPRYDTMKGRWVDVFYLLNDDTEKKIFGYHRVESNSPIMIQAKRLEDIRNADRILKEKIKDSLAKLESNSKKTNSPIPIKKVIKVKTEKIYIISTSNGKIIKSKGYRVNNKKRITDIQRVDGTFVRLRTSKIISIKQNGKELLIN